MTNITAKQTAAESCASATDWMASFLDSQISKLEERSEDVFVGLNAELRIINQKPIWN
jgi:hypothetical protein